jgi:HSP20 family molecular chaperone IbpA
MNTIILPTASHRRVRHPKSAASLQAFRHPHYECETLDDALRLTVYLPGVEAAGVEIATRGPDLTVTARKRQIVRVNWQALHLERAQRPYQLNLRLGRGLDYGALGAELKDGVLTIVLPRKQTIRSVDDQPRQVA